MSRHAVTVGTYPAAGPDPQAHGLALESTYLWGLFRSTTGDIWSALRRLSGGSAWPSRLLLQTNAGATAIVRLEPAEQPARSSDVVADGRGGWRADGFELVVGPGTMRWHEAPDGGELVDLAGTEVAPGLQWCLLPSGDHEGMGYRSRIFRVEGTVAGAPAAGFVGCDEVHLVPGRQNYVDDPLTAGHLSDAWCTWATAYDDGTVEAGHLAFGRDGFGFGLRSTGGTADTTTRVSGVVSRDEAGRPARITFDVDGESWEFDADPRGMALQPLPGPVRQAEGWCRRAGETRRPVVWCATPEVPAP
jgi:hypothetical protein